MVHLSKKGSVYLKKKNSLLLKVLISIQTEPIMKNWWIDQVFSKGSKRVGVHVTCHSSFKHLQNISSCGSWCRGSLKFVTWFRDGRPRKPTSPLSFAPRSPHPSSLLGFLSPGVWLGNTPLSRFSDFNSPLVSQWPVTIAGFCRVSLQVSGECWNSSPENG